MPSSPDAGTYESTNRTFYKARDAMTRPSADAIVPLMLKLYQPASVIDLGCGVGTWLSVFAEHGVAEVFGVEGDEVDEDLLKIPPTCFQRADLSKLLKLDRRFDLAITLEVGEHLPPESGPSFVKSLVNLAPVVMFSAAIPNQGGIHHVNEQWPQYWIDLFAGHGYVTIDVLRRQIWHQDQIKAWYRQNLFIFARKDMLSGHPALEQAYEATDLSQVDLVHPQMFAWKYADYQRELAKARNLTLGDVARMLPTLLRKSIVSHWRQLFAPRPPHNQHQGSTLTRHPSQKQA